MSLAQQLAVRCCMYLLNVNIYILRQMYNYTSLCCVCTLTSGLCEREQNRLLARCIAADNAALQLNSRSLIRAVNRSTCDPYFKATLSSDWQFCASSAATWPELELLACSQTLLWTRRNSASSYKCWGKVQVSPGTDTRQQLLLFECWVVAGKVFLSDSFQNWGL